MINQIKRDCENHFMKEYNLSLAEDWLDQCIQWLIQEFPVNTFHYLLDDRDRPLN